MIDSEIQAMAAEIDRIARATDFNGLKLLDGSLFGNHDGSGLQANGRMKIHFGMANDSAEDYYYIKIGDCTTRRHGLRQQKASAPPESVQPDGPIEYGRIVRGLDGIILNDVLFRNVIDPVVNTNS